MSDNMDSMHSSRKRSSTVQVWFQLYTGTTGNNVVTPVGDADCVTLSIGAIVKELRNAVKQERANALRDVDAGDLQVYPAGTLVPVGDDVVIPAGTARPRPGAVVPTDTTDLLPLIVVVVLPVVAVLPVPHAGYELVEELIVLNDADLTRCDVVTGLRREHGSTTTPQLYFRKHLVEQKRQVDLFMNSTTFESRLYVAGPPGSGKTSFFLLYCTQWLRQQPGKKGLIVQFRESSNCEIMIVESSGSVSRVCSPILSYENLLDVLKLVLRREGTENFAFFLHDGVRQKVVRSWVILGFLNANFTNATKGIHVTSLQFHIHLGDGAAGIDGTDQFMYILSWELSDYIDAYKSGFKTSAELIALLKEDDAAAPADIDIIDTGASDDTEDKMILLLLERKFYYAGGSARFMFDLRFTKLVSTVLPDLFGRMRASLWEEYAELTITAQSETAINSLLQSLPHQLVDGRPQATPVSKYVLRQAYNHCKNKLVKSMTTAAQSSGNPVLQGWAFELEQINLVERSSSGNITIANASSSLVLPNRLPITITNAPSSLVLPNRLPMVFYDGRSISGETSGSGFFIFCQRWNQGCFDMAYFVDETLVTLQFTKRRSHSLKIGFIGLLKNALENMGKTVRTFYHVGIVQDPADAASFKFDGADGAGSDDGNRPSFTVNLARSTKLIQRELFSKVEDASMTGETFDQIQVFANPRRSNRLLQQQNN
jgi:hypothetical protein